MITTDMSLGQIVDRIPAGARILQESGLDFCCGGQQTLGDACSEHGVSSETVIAALEGLGDTGAADWTSYGPSELVDHVVSTHHEYLRRQFDFLVPLAQKVATVHGERHPELAEVYSDVRELADDLLPHMQKEEQVLFPMIVSLAETGSLPPAGPPHLDMPISVMVLEHDACGELLRKMRSDSRDFAVPADGCASYQALYAGLEELEADTHLHIHKENNILFPMVLELEQESAVADGVAR